MTTITPNRQGLKFLADFNIDAQFCQKYGAQVFNYSGDATDQYRAMCDELLKVLTDLVQDINDIKDQLPVNTYHN